MSTRPVYAPLPARAMVDRRLSERHLRTLAVVAAHDRLGKNGIGCWASHQRLAAMVGCHYTRISHNLKELGALGYIEQVEHPLNKRLRVYRVLYTDDDGKIMKAAATDDSCPNGQVSDDPTVAQSDSPNDGIVAQSGKSPAEIVVHQNQEVADSVKEPQVNIFPEGGNRLGEASEIDSAEAAPLGSGAPTQINIGAQLARFERELKAGAKADVDAMKQWHDWLEELHDSLDINDPNSGRAYRLLEEIEWPEEVYSQPAPASTAPAGPHRAGDPDCDCYACDYDRDTGTSGTAQGAVRKSSERQPPCQYPKLFAAFEDDPEKVQALRALSADNQRLVSAAFATKGHEAAAAMIEEMAHHVGGWAA